MDADTIRLILIVVGAILILGLYLWERSRDPGRQDEDDDSDDAYDRTRGKHEPNLGRVDEADLDGRPGAQLDLEGDEAALAGPAHDAPLLIQLSVAKRQGDFDGEDLLEVAGSCGLRPGDMDIFHCLDEFDDGTRIYFSMANMVKPGTFPFDDMDGFSTPGVMLFAQLEGYPEDLTVLEEMIATGRKIANTLGGDVLDETRRPLTVRKEEDLRNAVLAQEARRERAQRR